MGQQTTIHVLKLLAQLQAGNIHARDSLIDLVYPKMFRLSRQMLSGFPTVGRWDDTGDVCQLAALRLYRSLESCHPASALHFYRLAGQQIRRTLIELARKHQGPLGLAKNHDTGFMVAEESDSRGSEPLTLEQWAEFHEQVSALPEEMRDAFELLWYSGLEQQDAAKVLGISLRGVQRRWRNARLTLSRRLQESLLTSGGERD